MDFETRRRPSLVVAAVSRRRFLAWTAIATGTLAAGGLWRLAPTAFGQLAAQPAVWNHDPASPIGPSRWAEIGYPICGSGMSQSPINIDTRAVRTQSGPALGLSYQDSPLEIENTGHVVEVEIPSDITNSLSIGNDTYSLVQYHFHTPSEHTIDGQATDIEAHFVHMSALGASAVVGVLFQIGDNPNSVLETILRSASTKPGDTIDAGEANPMALFPGGGGGSQVPIQLPTARAVSAGFSHQANIESFYSYDGSLTTTGCTEGVRWFVLTDVGHVSSSALDDLHHVISLFPDYAGYANNVRPVQPLNDRVVALRVAGE